MTIIICPTEQCNFKCSGCFEPEQQRVETSLSYNFDLIQQSLHAVWKGSYNGSDVCLHGGECTLIPLQEFEKLLSLIYNLPWKCEDGSIKPKGAVSIVTNGSRITDGMIELFKKYNVHVGISKDGPAELNVFRGPNPSDKKTTEEYNRNLWETIRKLRAEGISVAIMCILHKRNAATTEQLKKMGKWIMALRKIGITGGRFNPMYSNMHPELQLTNDELYRAWNYFYKINKKYGLQWNPLREMEKNLQEEKNRPCIFAKCDKFATHTLSILPSGQIGNCDRTFADGMYLRSLDRGTSGRYLALEQTQCKDCKYWMVCSGGCPEEGGEGDWRNRTRFCNAIYRTYEYIEETLKKENPSIVLQARAQQGMDADHGDATHGDVAHGDAGHGDSTHGDSGHGNSLHGDQSHGNMSHGDSGHGDMQHGDMQHGDSHHGDSPDYLRRDNYG